MDSELCIYYLKEMFILFWFWILKQFCGVLFFFIFMVYFLYLWMFLETLDQDLLE